MYVYVCRQRLAPTVAFISIHVVCRPVECRVVVRVSVARRRAAAWRRPKMRLGGYYSIDRKTLPTWDGRPEMWRCGNTQTCVLRSRHTYMRQQRAGPRARRACACAARKELLYPALPAIAGCTARGRQPLKASCPGTPAQVPARHPPPTNRVVHEAAADAAASTDCAAAAAAVMYVLAPKRSPRRSPHRCLARAARTILYDCPRAPSAHPPALPRHFARGNADDRLRCTSQCAAGSEQPPTKSPLARYQCARRHRV